MDNQTVQVPMGNGHAPAEEARPDLRRRYDAASACLNAHPTDLPWLFLAEFAPMLQTPALRETPASEHERGLVDEVLRGLAKGLDQADPTAFARRLAAAMFYFAPHELPPIPPPSRLPVWLRVAYLNWSLALPSHAGHGGSTERYLRWLDGWLQVLAIEFERGACLEDLPPYQRQRFRRLLTHHLILIRDHFGSFAPGSSTGSGDVSLHAAIERSLLILDGESSVHAAAAR